MTREWCMRYVLRSPTFDKGQKTYQTFGVPPLPEVGSEILVREMFGASKGSEETYTVTASREVIEADVPSMGQARRVWEVVLVPASKIDRKNRQPPPAGRKK